MHSIPLALIVLGMFIITLAALVAWTLKIKPFARPSWHRPVDPDDCMSGWDDDPFLAEEVRAALNPINVEDLPVTHDEGK